MSDVRKNTLVIDLSVLPVRPSAGIIKQFLDEKLKLDMASVKNLQLHTIRNCALIEMCSLEAAERIAAAHHLKHSIAAEKKNFNIPVYMEDCSTNVRIHDLPPGIPNSVVADHLKEYGKVKSVARELWKKFFPGIPNGVRMVRIELVKHIPSYIRITEQICTVTYRSQIATCRQCQRKAHPRKKCSEISTDNKDNEVNLQQPPIVHSEADNSLPMDVAVEMDAIEKQNKRPVSSRIEPATKSPPRKIQAMDGNEKIAPSARQQAKAAKPIEKQSSDDQKKSKPSVNNDSDSGPDPADDDIEGWIVKCKKRSIRHDKRIAELLSNHK